MSKQQVTNLAVLACDQGMAPGMLTVIPMNKTLAGMQPAATVMDFVPLLNIKPFGMCKTQANPMVAAATAAAQGVLTPMPCIPVTTSPWSPGSAKIQIGGQKALLNSDTCKCMWTGTISIKQPGQQKVQDT
jgi:hypothetical protein